MNGINSGQFLELCALVRYAQYYARQFVQEGVREIGPSSLASIGLLLI